MIPRSLFPPLLLACLAWPAAAPRAQPAEAPAEAPAETPASAPQAAPVRLRSSPRLDESISAEQRSALPTFLFGDLVTGRPDLDMVLQGGVELRRGDTVIRADRVEYYQPDDRVKARGHVRLNRAGNVFEGPLLELKVDAFQGFFSQPQYQFLANDAYGEAERVDFLDSKRAVMHKGTLTTCRREGGPDWMPAWLLRTTSLAIDSEDEVGVAQDARIDFQGVPILALPKVSFALSEKRKSGFLAPTFGVDSVSGTVVTVPYYWNIAPNRDLTLYPTLMGTRGVNMGSEFRYLESSYTGRLRADYLPSDQLRNADRWGTSYQHQGLIDTGSSRIGNLALNLNVNRVSDDNYWRDFLGATPPLNQRLLPSSASLGWSRGFFSTSLNVLQWQTLQDPTTPIGRPYDRLPQLTANYTQLDLHGLDVSVSGDYTQFQVSKNALGAPTMLDAQGASALQPNAQRNVLLAQISRPWLGAAGFITPKLQLHSTLYQFDAPLPTNGSSSVTRAVPIFSLDSGLMFERNAGYFGRAFVQTLEPRLYYTYTPFVDQNYLPNYDTGLSDFNFASIYSENSFIGNDRIADNNLLTAGVTTRLLSPVTGTEAARFGIAQRYRFADQNVTLPGGTPVKERFSDLLLGAAFNWDARWVFDSLLQYNPSSEKSVRSTVSARYNPSPYHVLNTAYRFQRDVSELVDIGWQWPLNDLWGDKGQDLGPGQGQGPGRWYGVGRLNYSLPDSKLIDTIVGFEYDAGCWLGRVVLERQQTGLVTSNQRIMFQLELVGFSRLGIDPLQTLKNNIPRYQPLRDQINAPSRFSNYD